MSKNIGVLHGKMLIALPLGASFCAFAGTDGVQPAITPVCQVMPWSESAPVNEPAMPPGTSWVYVAGDGIPPNKLTLTQATAKGKNIYAMGNGREHIEVAATYAESSSARKGRSA